MLEPSLHHHQKEYKRLGRVQLCIVLGAIASVFIFEMTHALLALPKLVESLVVMGALITAAVMLLILEVRKLLTYRKDLLERKG